MTSEKYTVELHPCAGDGSCEWYVRGPDQVYRCLRYVRAEVNRLAEQAADVIGGGGHA